MKNHGLRLLTLSLAEGMAQRGPALSDPQVHHSKYLRFLACEHIVVKTPPGGSREPFEFAPGLRAYPTASAGRFSFVLDCWRAARRILAEHPIDLIAAQEPFGTGPVGLVLARLARKPLVVHDVCDFIDNPRWLAEEPINRLLNPVGKLVLRAADGVRVDNEEERQKLIALGLAPEKIFNVPFVLNDAEKFARRDTPPGLRARLLDNGRFERIVLLVGRLEDQKDVPCALRAARRLSELVPRVRFVVVGGGKKESELKAMASGLGDSVLFAGFVPYDALPDYYHSADVFLLSSLYETSPRVLALACLAELPIVSTRVSGATDLVRDGENGWLVEVGDDAAMAVGLAGTLGDQGAARAMGRRSAELSAALGDEEAILARTEAMYRFVGERDR